MLHRLLIPAVAVTALGLSACGSDTSTSSSATPAATAKPAMTDMPGMTTPAATSGQTQSSALFDASSGSVTVKATEYAFGPSQISAKAGKLTITMENDGKMVHELVLLKTDAAPGALKVTNGRVSEDDSVGEIGETPAGKSASHTFTLRPGKYLIVCNVKGHYMAGMFGQIIVS